MKTIGITGNIGSGKSTVEKRLAELLRVPSLDMDAVAKKVTAENVEIIRNLSPNCEQNGVIDYDILFAEVFSSTAKIRKVNHHIHPLVEKQVGLAIENFRQQGFPAVVISSALFFEARIKTDFLIAVDCPENIRLHRVLKKYLESEKDFESARKKYKRAERLNELQFPSDRMRYYCDWVINNNCSPGEQEEQIENIAGTLLIKMQQEVTS